MKEALELALEALEWCHGGEPCGTAEAITAIKAALAQPTSGDYALGYAEGFNDACKPKPAQRTWVGLDEKDFSAINQSCLTKLQAATSAESILKEKNNGLL